MKVRFYQKKGFYLTLLAAVLIIASDLLMAHKPEFFVGEGGHFKIYQNLSFLTIGLFLNWKFSRHILGLVTLFGVVILIFAITHFDKELIGSQVALLSVMVVILVLLLSKNVKQYVEQK